MTATSVSTLVVTEVKSLEAAKETLSPSRSLDVTAASDAEPNSSSSPQNELEEEDTTVSNESPEVEIALSEPSSTVTQEVSAMLEPSISIGAPKPFGGATSSTSLAAEDSDAEPVAVGELEAPLESASPAAESLSSEDTEAEAHFDETQLDEASVLPEQIMPAAPEKDEL
ncbi:hypothetical protein N0V90_011730 [Kalmusia sp. IMI 367209]|nr:hypothetical protein N0V90_011730 [Kalmusia sp. IMI 367209]